MDSPRKPLPQHLEIRYLKMELAELRHVIMAVVNEMKQMRADFNSGLKACQKAFHLCKDAYENCEEAYNDIDATMAESFQ